MICYPFADESLRGRIAPMAIDDQDAFEPLLGYRIEDVTHHRHVGFHPKSDRSRKRPEVRCDAIGQDGKYRNAYRFGRFNSQSFRQKPVRAQAQISVLFRAAQWQHRAVVTPEIFFHHHPIHFADSHVPKVIHSFRRFTQILRVGVLPSVAQPIRTTRRSSAPRETNSGNSLGCKIPARISRLSTMRGPGRAKYAPAFMTYTWPLSAAEIERKPGNRLSNSYSRRARSMSYPQSASTMISGRAFNTCCHSICADG